MAYTVPNATNITAFAEYPNTVTGGWFWNLIVLAVFFITFSSLKTTSPTLKAFAGATFVTAVPTFFLSIMGLVWFQTVTAMIIMGVFSILALRLRPEG